MNSRTQKSSAGALVAEPLQERAVPPAALPAPGGAAPKGDLSPVQMLHRSLRGRYLFVVPLALVLAALGGVAGWRWTKPQYRSDALIEIKYNAPAVDGSAYQTSTTPYQVFFESQKMLIMSRRVVDRALEEPAWTELHRPLTPQVVHDFIDNLEVKPQRGTEYLQISYLDPDPRVAAAAVNAVIGAYVKVYEEDEQHLESTRLHLLRKRKQELEARIHQMEAETDEVVKRYGSADLAPLQNDAVRRTTELADAIGQIELALASRSAEAPTPPSAGPAAEPATSVPDHPLTPEQIAQNDGTMRNYLDEQRKLQENLDILCQVRRYGESHPQVIEARYLLQQITARIQQYAGELNAVQQATGRPAVGGAGGGQPAATMATQPTEFLRTQEKRLMALLDNARAEMTTLATEEVLQSRREQNLRRDREESEVISKRIDSLENQEKMGGRLTVISGGEIPLSPEPDRRIKFAAACAAFGGAMPVGLFVVFGLLRRRYKYADETVADLAPSAPLLGVLPTLYEPLDEDSAMLAAQRIHQIRVMLQATMPARPTAAYLVTSASAGEGKTSLAMSLALSFAATGLRTLLIDADLVGQQVTRGMQARDLPGLREALRAGSLDGCLRRTAAGLCVLPVGNAGAHDACAVSPAALQELMREARRYFQAILIDSGPVLGSVEAAMLARDVDGVLLTVAQGQQAPVVRRALQHLGSLGATVCGFVFNRARSSDFYRSHEGSLSRSRSDDRLPTEALAVRRRRCRLGPLVAAVISSLPQTLQPSPSGL
jgi:Mrp family chromosome partitioning ATPase/capsular polysaccharide biosynthesis protein